MSYENERFISMMFSKVIMPKEKISLKLRKGKESVKFTVGRKEVGYALVSTDGNTLYINHLEMNPQAQGKGYEVAALERLKREAERQGKKAVAEVFPAEAHLYEKAGIPYYTDLL